MTIGEKPFSKAEFAAFGKGEVLYLRKKGSQFTVYMADGSELAVVGSFLRALQTAESHDMAIDYVH